MSRRLSARVRRRIYGRDGHCLHCGRTTGLSIQHRANRGMGGAKFRDNPANLITLCLLSNILLESDAAAASRGIAHGWKLRQMDDPLATPVLDALTGEEWLLDDEYGRRLA